jgi:hypothetical protein
MPITDLRNRDAVIAALAEFDSLGQTAFLKKYGFGKSREYQIFDPATGKLYDSKAIVGAAYGYAFPEQGPLSAADFSGGEATVQKVLQKLGFEVRQGRPDWSAAEVQAIIEDYFEMLNLESQGVAYNKSAHNGQLQQRIPARSTGSIEFKHTNISAVLAELGLPYILGYKPRSNVQDLLRQMVQEHIERHRASLLEVMDNFDVLTPSGAQQFRGVLIDTPIVERYVPSAVKVRTAKKFDFATREDRNRLLGRNGEAWTVEYEKVRLGDDNRLDLANKIDWVSDRLGDGLGYDILSYDSSESASKEQSRFIEVKTTNSGAANPFIVTRNEVEFSEEQEDAFCLYRIFNFAKQPHLFILRGPLSAHVELEALDYKARLLSGSA